MPPFSTSYSRTTSSQREGSLGYATIDLGFNVATSPTWQLGPFVGFHFLREIMNDAGLRRRVAIWIFACRRSRPACAG